MINSVGVRSIAWILWIIGGQVCIRVQAWVWGHAPLGNFDFGPFIRHNLMESGTAFAIYCVIKACKIAYPRGGKCPPAPPWLINTPLLKI